MAGMESGETAADNDVTSEGAEVLESENGSDVGLCILLLLLLIGVERRI